MSEDHSKEELEIFAGFADACELGIITGSLEKRKPPEPDILCRIDSDEHIAFELLELVDQQRIARMRGIQDEVMDGFREGFRNMSDDDRSKMKERLGNATIRVRMSPKVSSHKRRAVIGKVLKQLLNVDAQLEGDYRLPPELNGIVRATIVRGNFDGPRFTAMAASFYDPIPTQGLIRKFHNAYSNCAPVELLAYFNRQEAPPESEIDRLVVMIKTELGASVFTRVWIYDAQNRRVCAVIEKGKFTLKPSD
jgi:hypothetical protein